MGEVVWILFLLVISNNHQYIIAFRQCGGRSVDMDSLKFVEISFVA